MVDAQQDHHVFTSSARTPQSRSSAGLFPLYGDGDRMATNSNVGIDVLKHSLDVAVLGVEEMRQVDNTR